MSNISISEWLGKICIKRTTLFTDVLLNDSNNIVIFIGSGVAWCYWCNNLIYQNIANCNFSYIKIRGELLIDTIVP